MGKVIDTTDIIDSSMSLNARIPKNMSMTYITNFITFFQMFKIERFYFVHIEQKGDGSIVNHLQ